MCGARARAMCCKNDPVGADPRGDGLVAKRCELRPGFGQLRQLFPQSTTEVLSQHWRKYLVDYPAPAGEDMSHPSADRRALLERMLRAEGVASQEVLGLIRGVYKNHYPALLVAAVEAEAVGRRLRSLSARTVRAPKP